jgi:hypothetical protein
MAERLEIVMDLMNLGTVLRDFARVENAITRLNRVSAMSNATPGMQRAAEFRLAAAQLGRIAAVATLVVGTLTALAESLHRLNGIIEEFANLRLFHGATTAQAATSSAIFGALGFSPGEIGAMGARLHERIAGGGAAGSAAARLGVFGVRAPGFGGPNDLQIMNRLARGLRQIGDAQERYNLAILLGEPELLRAAQLQGELAQNAQAIAEMQQRVMGPAAQRRAQEFSVFWNQVFQVIRLQFAAFADNVIRGLGFSGSGIQQQADALQQNTSALNQNTVAIGNMRAIFGGGERARGAFPAGLRGEMLRRQMESDAIKLGAFKL